MSFTTRLFLSLLVFSLIVLAIVGGYVGDRMEAQLYSQIGKRALVQAKEIAVIPALVTAVEQRDTTAISTLMMRLYEQTDASFIVIGDDQGIRLFHPNEPSLYVPMVGGDNDDVLKGESIVSIRRGTLGQSLRGKAPILNDSGTVIGIVSVGYLLNKINYMHFGQLAPILIFLLILLVTLFAFSWFFSRHIKRQMLGLEPREISRIVQQQDAVFETIFEGVIAIDTNYRITAINQAARIMLNLNSGVSPTELVGQNLTELIRPADFFCAADNVTTDRTDEIRYFNGLAVIASRIRIRIDNQLQGWVITFRDRNDINTLSLQLSQVRRYADSLRVMRHEHLNWIATLSGLLHMQRYDEAIRLIEAQSATNQMVLDFVSRRFFNPSICGLLLGKYARAHELGLELVFDPACQLSSLPQTLNEIELMSIIGNLLDNAFEATLRSENTAPQQERRRIELYISDASDDLVIEVADTGCGIDPAIRDHIFERGVTTQNEGDHGIGLYLVSTHVTQAQGTITVDENLPTGTIFSIFIPKNTSSSLNNPTAAQDQFEETPHDTKNH